MRFTLAQLRKFQMPYHFVEEEAFTELVGFEGIKSIPKMHVEGIINRVDDETYTINFSLICDLILECAVTLKDVPYHININFKEVFATDESDETFKIDGQTLDTKEAIITNLLINKPIKVYADGAEFVDENEEFPEEEKSKSSPFASLKDLF